MKKYFFVVFAILLLYSYNICGQERLAWGCLHQTVYKQIVNKLETLFATKLPMTGYKNEEYEIKIMELPTRNARNPSTTSEKQITN